MKKKALSLLLALCMLLSLLPTTAFATSVTKKTNEVYNSTASSDNAIDLNTYVAARAHEHSGTYYANGGIELTNGVYYLSGDLTVSGEEHNCDWNSSSGDYDHKDAAGNALKIKDGDSVVIYPNGYTLTVDGADAADGKKGKDGGDADCSSVSDTEGANGDAGDNSDCVGYAAILLPESATLTFIGTGTVNATGGKAGNGGDAGDGGDADTYAFVGDSHWQSGGRGGAGGSGSGGGTAIGTDGTLGVDNDGTADTPATAGTLRVYDDGASGGSITMNLTGGAAGSDGLAGSNGKGECNSITYWVIVEVTDYFSAAGGGRGGYGGAGGAGAAYGSGGAGGTAGTNGSRGGEKDDSTYGTDSHGDEGSDGSKGADASGAAVKTYDTYVLKGITADVVTDAFYTGAGKTAVQSVLDTNANILVMGYYNKNGETYSATKAIDGVYDNDSNWRVWYVNPNHYVTSVTDNEATTDPALTEIKVNYITMDHASDATNPGSAISTTMLYKDASAKDHTTNAVVGGDAVKFNDENLKTTISNTNDIAATYRVPYIHKNYSFNSGEAETKLGTGELASSGVDHSSANNAMTYTVYYTPYNAYTEAYDTTQSTNYGNVPAEGKYLLGGTDDFKPYSDLRSFNFRNAGLYTITEKIVHNDDQYDGSTYLDQNGASVSKTFYKTYYLVIEQADLLISQAADTVHENTKVQNHQFTRFVEGQNDEQVFGTFTFAAEHGEDWGNNENRVVNASIPMQNGIDWEFNVFENEHHDQSGSTKIYGTKNLNNYLCQKDGPSAVTQAEAGHTSDVQNTYYQGRNGILSFNALKADGNGVNVIPAPMKVTFRYEHDQRNVNTMTARQLTLSWRARPSEVRPFPCRIIPAPLTL